MSKDNKQGTIYIFTNKAMPEYIKIGRTCSDVQQRMKELDRTGIPLPFECYYAAEVENVEKVEALIHSVFKDRRVRKNREFFKVNPERVISAIKLVEVKNITPEVETDSDAPITDLEESISIATRQPNLTFSEIEIAVGTELEFINDSKIICTVIDDKKVEFRDQILSLSEAALIVRIEQGYTSKTINGWHYWTYKGVRLTGLRCDSEAA